MELKLSVRCDHKDVN